MKRKKPKIQILYIDLKLIKMKEKKNIIKQTKSTNLSQLK